MSFSINDIVPERVASVDGQDVRFPGSMSDADIQQASQDVYGAGAHITDGPIDTLKKFWTEVNPLALMKGIGQAVAHPVDTIKAVGAAQGALFDKAQAAADSGDYVTATRHFINYLLPLVGPGLDESADMAQRGEVFGAAGKAAGIGTMNLGPLGISRAQSIKVPLAPKANPVVADAVAFAQREGVPVTPAT